MVLGWHLGGWHGEKARPNAAVCVSRQGNQGCQSRNVEKKGIHSVLAVYRWKKKIYLKYFGA